MLNKPNKDLIKTNGYRPICLLSTLSNINEKMILKFLSIELDTPGLFDSSYQYGFRKYFSTEFAVHDDTHNLVTNMQCKKGFYSNYHLILKVFFFNDCNR